MVYSVHKEVGFERSRFEEQTIFVFRRAKRKHMTGIIKKITDKGFGFISSDELPKDVFFHSKNLVGVLFDELREGEAVSFDTEDSPKGMNAVNVQRA